jgi:hypothetical protein
VAGDDSLGVFLEQAQKLLGCGQLLAIEDAAASLSDPLLYKPHKECSKRSPRASARGSAFSRRVSLTRLASSRLALAISMSFR